MRAAAQSPGWKAGRRWGRSWCPRLSSQAPRPADLGKGRGLRPCTWARLFGSIRSGFLEGPESLPPFFLFRLFSASGDMRTNGDKYLYEIQLSSITSSRNPACSGANICQVKPNDQHFSRKVGTSDKTKYYIQGNCFPSMFHVQLLQRDFKNFMKTLLSIEIPSLKAAAWSESVSCYAVVRTIQKYM